MTCIENFFRAGLVEASHLQRLLGTSASSLSFFGLQGLQGSSVFFFFLGGGGGGGGCVFCGPGAKGFKFQGLGFSFSEFASRRLQPCVCVVQTQA